MWDEESSHSSKPFKTCLDLELKRVLVYLHIFMGEESEGIEVPGWWGEFRKKCQRTVDAMSN